MWRTCTVLIICMITAPLQWLLSVACAGQGRRNSHRCGGATDRQWERMYKASSLVAVIVLFRGYPGPLAATRVARQLGDTACQVGRRRPFPLSKGSQVSKAAEREIPPGILTTASRFRLIAVSVTACKRYPSGPGLGSQQWRQHARAGAGSHTHSTSSDGSWQLRPGGASHCHSTSRSNPVSVPTHGWSTSRADGDLAGSMIRPGHFQ